MFFVCFTFCPWGHCFGQGVETSSDVADNHPFPEGIELDAQERKDGEGSWSYVVPTLDNLKAAADEKAKTRKRWSKVHDSAKIKTLGH